MSIFSAIVLLLLSITALVIAVTAIIRSTTVKYTKPPAPRKKNPIDKHMDDNYADIDWLRKGKL